MLIGPLRWLIYLKMHSLSFFSFATGHLVNVWSLISFSKMLLIFLYSENFLLAVHKPYTNTKMRFGKTPELKIHKYKSWLNSFVLANTYNLPQLFMYYIFIYNCLISETLKKQFSRVENGTQTCTR